MDGSDSLSCILHFSAYFLLDTPVASFSCCRLLIPATSSRERAGPMIEAGLVRSSDGCRARAPVCGVRQRAFSALSVSSVAWTVRRVVPQRTRGAGSWYRDLVVYAWSLARILRAAWNPPGLCGPRRVHLVSARVGLLLASELDKGEQCPAKKIRYRRSWKIKLLANAPTWEKSAVHQKKRFLLFFTTYCCVDW